MKIKTEITNIYLKSNSKSDSRFQVGTRIKIESWNRIEFKFEDNGGLSQTRSTCISAHFDPLTIIFIKKKYALS